MPRCLVQTVPNLNKRSYNKRNSKPRDKSYLSDLNIISQEKRLRGRVLKPVEWVKRKRVRHPENYVNNNQNHLIPIKKLVKQAHVAVHNEATEQSNINNPIILYKPIESRWLTNLRIFYNPEIGFLDYFRLFPFLIGVTIKVFCHTTSAESQNDKINVQNYIFPKETFMSIFRKSSEAFTEWNHNILLIKRRKSVVQPIKPAPKEEATEHTQEISPKIEIKKEEDEILDLRKINCLDQPTSTSLNPTIVNKLNRLNTVIRRIPQQINARRCLAFQNVRDLYHEHKRTQMNQRSNNGYNKINNIIDGRFQVVQIGQRKFQVESKKRIMRGYGGRTSVIKSTLSPMTSVNISDLNKPPVDEFTRKTEMWMSYTSASESFDRNVSVSELESMPIQSFYDPVEPINLDYYL